MTRDVACVVFARFTTVEPISVLTAGPHIMRERHATSAAAALFLLKSLPLILINKDEDV